MQCHDLNAEQPGKVTRRQTMAGGAAVAMFGAAPLPKTIAADPVLALYETWHEANEEALRRAHAMSEGYRVLEAEYGASAPRIRTGRSFAFPCYVSSELEIDGQTEGLMFLDPERGQKRRAELKAALKEETARWHTLCAEHGVTRLADAYDEASSAESDAYDRLLETAATTPAGAALKFRAALSYAPDNLGGWDCTANLMAAALRDLEHMGPAGD
jgi:hypothetical protein